MPTPGSNAGSRSPWPMPRIYALIDGPNAAAVGFRETLGASATICVRLVCPRPSSDFESMAVMDSGVFCTLSERNCAVTTTSCKPSEACVTGAPAGAADWACSDEVPSAAAIAAERLSKLPDLIDLFISPPREIRRKLSGSVLLCVQDTRSCRINGCEINLYRFWQKSCDTAMVRRLHGSHAMHHSRSV